MTIMEAIEQRRSIRAFKGDPVPRETVSRILEAGIMAPSGKNKQPWKFIVVEESKRAEMIEIMKAGIAKVKAEGEDTGSSEWTVQVMEQAPVTVFIFNPHVEFQGWPHRSDVVDTQSIGAAIQNMLLAAMEYGLGSLWICDVFYAYDGLCEWLGEKSEMIAAVSFGVPDQSPDPRPRKPFEETVVWFEGGN